MKCEDCVFAEFDPQLGATYCALEGARWFRMRVLLTADEGCDLGQPKEPTK